MTEETQQEPTQEAPKTETTPEPVEEPKISINEFMKIQFKVGTILEAEDHPNADKLLVIKVDLGEGTPRQVVAGIKSQYEPSALVGKQVAVVANLKPAKLRGIESQGMILAASDGDKIVIIGPEQPVSPGSSVK